jgi:hypothetical protein
MFGSDHDGERATAARLADRLVRQHGLTWGDVLKPDETAADPLPMPWPDVCEARALPGFSMRAWI